VSDVAVLLSRETSAHQRETELNLPVITSVEAARAAIKQFPGKDIPGLGELPKVEPVKESHRAYRRKPGAPESEQINQALDIYWEYTGFKAREDWSLKELAVFCFWQISESRGENKSLDNASPKEVAEKVDELVGYHKHEIVELARQQLPELVEEYEQFKEKRRDGLLRERDRKLEEIDAFEKDKEAHKKIYGMRTEIDKKTGEFLEVPRPQKEVKELVQTSSAENRQEAEEEFQQLIKEISQEPGYDGLKVMVEWRKPKRKYTTDFPLRKKWLLEDKATLLLVKTIGDLDSVAKNLLFKIKEETTDSDKVVGADMISRAIDEVLEERFKGKLKNYEQLREFFVDWLGSNKEKLDQDANKIRISDIATEWLVNGRLEFEMLSTLIESELGDYESVDEIDPIWREDYDRLIAVFDDPNQTKDQDVFNYVGARQEGAGLNKLGEVFRYVKERLWRPVDEGIMINTKGVYEIKDDRNWAVNKPLNLDIVDPSGPSETVLEELTQRQESVDELKVLGELEAEWRLATAMIRKSGLEVGEWQNWCLATKRLGLSSLAMRERNYGLQFKLKEVVEEGDQADGDGKKQRRFLSQGEIKTALAERVEEAGERDGIQRNFAIDSFWQSANLMRVDKENGWGKYGFDTKEWQEIYSQLYKCIKADYLRDSRPDSYVSSLRSSLINVMVGHEQYYKSRTRFSDTAYHFDELDLIMFLPSIAGENNNDPGFLLVAFKALMQMDESLRIEYQPMIEASIKQLVKQSEAMSWLVKRSGEIESALVPESNVWVNSSHYSDRVKRLDEEVIELFGRNPDLKPRAEGWAFENIDWVDKEVIIGMEGEFIAAVKQELVLSGRNRMIERVPAALAPVLKELALDREATGLKPLLTVAEVVEVLLGGDRPFDKTNLAETMTYLGVVIEAAVKLRGADRLEASKLIERLDQPIDIETVPLESFIQLVWQASGFIEREAVAAYTMTAMMAAFKVSVRRVFLKLEEFEIQNLAGEYEEALGLGRTESLEKAVAEVGLSFYLSRERLRGLIEKVNEEVFGERDNDRQAKRVKGELIREIGGMIAKAVAEIGKATDYEYSRTHWAQVMDQLFGDSLEGVDFLDSNGRVLLYCVQASFLAYEMMGEILEPCESQRWEVKPELRIALEDDYWGVEVDEYFKDLESEVKTGKAREEDNFNHYYVWIKMPMVEKGDKQYWLLVDQTEQKARFVPEEAMVTNDGLNVILDQQKTWEVDQQGKLKRPKEEKSIRIIVAPEMAGMSMGILGGVMESMPHLDKYGETVGQFHPSVSWRIARDLSKPDEDRRAALNNLVENFPFYMGEKGFSTPGQYGEDLSVLLRLANDNQLPVISLYVGRLMWFHGMIESRSKRIQLIKDCVLGCAMLKDDQWRMAKRQYKKILMAEDIQAIEKKRQWLEKKRLEKQKELARKAKKRVNKLSLTTKAYFSIDALIQAGEKEKLLRKTAKQLGSKHRFRKWRIKTEMDVDRQNLLLSDSSVDSSLGEVVNNEPLLVSSEADQPEEPVVSLSAPVAISGKAMNQAVEILLSQVDGVNVGKRLELIQATWRGFVRDGRISDKMWTGGLFAEKSWKNLQIIDTALKDKGLPGSLSGMAEVLRMPKEEILALLVDRFKGELMLESGVDEEIIEK